MNGILRRTTAKEKLRVAGLDPRRRDIAGLHRQHVFLGLPPEPLFDRGDEVTVQAGDNGIRFLLVSGKPLEEPVAWYGPIVMNTQAELRQAFEELEQGKFLKK